jgi:RNA polymerase sigma-70 factor, ECF subfamily
MSVGMNTFSLTAVLLSEKEFMPPLSSAPVQCEAERNLFLLIPTNHRLDKKKDASNGSTDARGDEITRESAFASLVGRHARLMYSVAFSLLRNVQDAEDAVQEALLKLYRGKAWQQMNDEKAFLARTVWRVALDRLPKIKERSLDQSHDQFAGKGDSPETSAVRNAQAAHLRRMIHALPEELRQVLLLSAIEDLNSREVGFLLGIPEGTVRTRLMRARDELRRQFGLQKEGSDERL